MSETDVNGQSFSKDWPVVYSYSREQAIKDGVLFDVSELAQETGFKHNTVLSEAVHKIVTPAPTAEQTGETYKGRLFDVLFSAVQASRSIVISKTKPTATATFSVLMTNTEGHRITNELYVHAGPGDNGETVITIMVVGED